MNINILKSNFVEEPLEFVERKGLGHPDTLSDALAETLSVNYSIYTKQKFGAILHHNFDKVGLLGGASYVTFGKGYLTKPIRVLLNGRASTKFSGEIIPVQDLLIGWTKSFMAEKFPSINTEKDLEFHYNLSNQSSPGKTNEKGSEKGTRGYWFEPRNLNDLQEIKRLVSNDTSLGVGYFPYTRLESLVLKIENTLNSKDFNKEHPWIGSDIKVMGYRKENSFYITLCIPQIAQFVNSIGDYKENLNYSRQVIQNIAKDVGIEALDLSINTRDNFENSEIYLTAIGSSIESGDEGLVGRGNRINGVISPFNPMSMEGACGKNPVYHIGKIYYVASQKLSKDIFEKFGVANKVFMVSQSGRDLIDPWETGVIIDTSHKNINVKELESFIAEALMSIPKLTSGLLENKYQL
ncbi:methionine adenosyltransferase, partial [Patescibacteria group bacterium]|nr:methionine adenosyltransferase [Patescibacteria group bacterium]